MTTLKTLFTCSLLFSAATVAALAHSNDTNVYWGDTHLHTSASGDAAARGNRLDVNAAYRFARGEKVTSTTGLEAQLNRPLDFLVIADHSDGMGFFGMLASGHPRILEEELGQRWHQLLKEGKGLTVSKELISGFAQGTLPWATNDPELMTTVWEHNIAAAERFNQPGEFTALIGYEWTSLIKGNNLHRVVVLRDDGDRARKMLPYTLADSADPEDLWEYLGKYEQTTGGSALAIPHNANLSNGMMFASETIDGNPLDADYAARRARWEPLMEISQIKGDGEAHPFLSPNDEFADFETWDSGNLDLSEAKSNDMLQYEYARAALKRGLGFDAKLGINPFQFGIIASTDSHTSLATADSDNFYGKHAGVEPSATRASKLHRTGPVAELMGWEQVASGYAAVWAKENTRAAIFDAMRRKETYGTTGPRMTVRFFGGWDFKQDDSNASDVATIGYTKGVPMGGSLTAAADKKAPSFLVVASKDPMGANLDRVQIVKGWQDASGQLNETVYNVAWSGKRKLDKEGKLAVVGSTVDIEQASWKDTIGDSQLATVWQDPAFDPTQHAFYYVRVLQIPTPRWPVYDAARFETDIAQGSPTAIQERAYTSPVWYRPAPASR